MQKNCKYTTTSNHVCSTKHHTQSQYNTGMRTHKPGRHSNQKKQLCTYINKMSPKRMEHDINNSK